MRSVEAGARPAIRVRPVPQCDPPFDDELMPELWAATQPALFEWPMRRPPSYPPGTTAPPNGPIDRPGIGGAWPAIRDDATAGAREEERPGAAGARGEGRPGAGALEEGRPGAAGALEKERPGATGTREEGRPGAAGTREHERPGAAGARGEGRSGAAGTREEGRPGAIGTREEGRPRAAGARGEGRPAAAGASPDARRAVRRFVSMCVEVLNGYRPAAHLRRVSAPKEAAGVVAQGVAGARRVAEMRRAAARPGDRHGRRSGPVGVLGLRLCEPRSGAVEAAVLLVTGERTWAMALRLEQDQRGWAATVLRLI